MKASSDTHRPLLRTANTIFAPSTAAGKAGVAVIRVSGPQARSALEAITRKACPAPRQAVLSRFSSPSADEVIDRGLVIWFPGPASFTGEDVAEFHVHGGRAVTQAMLDALDKISGLRPAEPGEFTRRAFDNGKLDLTAVEAIADLIAAETEMQRRQAVRQMEGALAEIYEGWRVRVLTCLANLEAWIDFPDEDLPKETANKVFRDVAALVREITQHLGSGYRGEGLRNGIEVAILGLPNVGKSTLINAIARRDVAIVSDIAGTTRDVLEVSLDLGGFPVTIMDTAGLRDRGYATDDPIEKEGMSRATARAEQADVKILVFDATQRPLEDHRIFDFLDDQAIVIVNKCDLAPVAGEHRVGGDLTLSVSAKTGEGLEALLGRIREQVEEKFSLSTTSPSLSRLRHRRALEECLENLRLTESSLPLEIAAEHLRLSARALGRITGRVDVEDILDVIFGDFCIGK